jgi:hypothetical protein
MPGSSFQTNLIDLYKLLDECQRGIVQLPDFQRSWVWDEDRIKSLIASVSRAFPVGALMTLDTGREVNFKPRPVEGAPSVAKTATVQSLLLDGQQRMTSLYQVTKKKVKRWFCIDIRKALAHSGTGKRQSLACPTTELSERILSRFPARPLNPAERVRRPDVPRVPCL